MRAVLGDGYVDALRATYKSKVPNQRFRYVLVADCCGERFEAAMHSVLDSLQQIVLASPLTGVSLTSLTDKKPFIYRFCDRRSHPWVDSGEGGPP